MLTVNTSENQEVDEQERLEQQSDRISDWMSTNEVNGVTARLKRQLRLRNHESISDYVISVTMISFKEMGDRQLVMVFREVGGLKDGGRGGATAVDHSKLRRPQPRRGAGGATDCKSHILATSL